MSNISVSTPYPKRRCEKLFFYQCSYILEILQEEQCLGKFQKYKIFEMMTLFLMTSAFFHYFIVYFLCHFLVHSHYINIQNYNFFLCLFLSKDFIEKKTLMPNMSKFRIESLILCIYFRIFYLWRVHVRVFVLCALSVYPVAISCIFSLCLIK